MCIRDSTYSGGTQIAGGVLEADSANALGTGDVYLGAGTLAVNAPAAVAIAGKFTQLQGTTLDLAIGPNGQGKLSVAGLTTIAGGTLHVKFVNGYTPKVGDTIAVVDGAGPNRQFASVVVDGFKATAVYTATGIQIRLDA